MVKEKAQEIQSQTYDTFLKDVSAYSNTSKGIIRFKIKSAKPVADFNDFDQRKITVETKIISDISPRPDFTFLINHKEETLDLVVFEGRLKPYLYKGKAYKRNNASNVKMSRLETKSMVLDYGNTTFDALEINDTLKFDYFNKLLQSFLGFNCDENVLKTFFLINDFGHYNNAGKIISDENNMGIDIVVYGENTNIIKDRETLENQSALEMYHKAINVFKENYVYEEIKDAQRIKREVIPLEAFKQALANAIVHRAYDQEGNIRIFMFKDCLEITSPGGLLPFIKKEEYLNGLISKLRNPILANVFFRLGYIKEFGNGIRQIKDIYASKNVSPSFNVYENTIQVILPTVNKRFTLNANEHKILLTLNGYTLSNSDLRKKVGFTKSKIIRILNSLILKKLVFKTGQGRGTKYFSHYCEKE